MDNLLTKQEIDKIYNETLEIVKENCTWAGQGMRQVREEHRYEFAKRIMQAAYEKSSEYVEKLIKNLKDKEE